MTATYSRQKMIDNIRVYRQPCLKLFIDSRNFRVQVEASGSEFPPHQPNPFLPIPSCSQFQSFYYQREREAAWLLLLLFRPFGAPLMLLGRCSQYYRCQSMAWMLAFASGWGHYIVQFFMKGLVMWNYCVVVETEKSFSRHKHNVISQSTNLVNLAKLL